MIGPVQLLVLGFSHPEFRGEVLAEIERLREDDTVRLIDALAVYKDAEGDESAGLNDLSTREQEVLALTAEGFSSREIGQKLFISPKTVDTYRSRIMDKLGLSHRSELVRFALRVGLLKEI